jgi:predicted DNA-binding transcriptional regulator YafY
MTMSRAANRQRGERFFLRLRCRPRSRSERLFDLVQLLRRQRQPRGSQTIAAELGISLRTRYRNIASLQAQGPAMDGAPGVGDVMQPGFELPPLVFSIDEVQASVLGSRCVMKRGDHTLRNAVRNVLAKVAVVLPAPLRHELDTSPLLVGLGDAQAHADGFEAPIRQASLAEHKLLIDYADAKGQKSRRTVRPFAMGFFDNAGVLLAWCELRAVMDLRATTLRTTAATPATPATPASCASCASWASRAIGRAVA